MSEAEMRLRHADDFPYDAPDNWLEDGRKTDAQMPTVDWAHRAARGVIADLTDRRGIKRGFEEVDEDVRVEIVMTLAGIIRLAHEEADA